ncbi:MAG: ROK family protein [Nanoarchaeota archaeon]
MTQNPVIAVDWGGTNRRFAIVQGPSILWEEKGPTFPTKYHDQQHDKKEITQRLFLTSLEKAVGQIRDFGVTDDIRLGVASAGPLNVYTGELLSPQNIGCGDFNIPQHAREYGIESTTVLNDVDGIGLGHYAFGEGKNVRHLGLIAPGTGLGVSHLVEGQPQQAGSRAGGMAFEGGHCYYPGLTREEFDAGWTHEEMRPHGYPTFEDMTAKGFWNLYQHVYGPSPLEKRDRMIRNAPHDRRPMLIEQAARQGDPSCMQTCLQVARHLGMYAATFQNHVGADVIVLDGSCANMFRQLPDKQEGSFRPGAFGQKMLDTMAEQFYKATWTQYHQTEFRLARLENAGILGAAYAARR